MIRRIQIMDCTLREGNQVPSYFPNADRRVQGAQIPDKLGVDTVQPGLLMDSLNLRVFRPLGESGLNANLIGCSRALARDFNIALKGEPNIMHFTISVSDVQLGCMIGKSRSEGVSRDILGNRYEKVSADGGKEETGGSSTYLMKSLTTFWK